MPQNKSIELDRIRQLVDGGEFEEALHLMNEFEEREDNSLYDIVSCHLLKCDLLYQRGQYQDAIQLAEQTYKESLGLGNTFLLIDILNLMTNLLTYLGDTEKAHELLKQGEELLKPMTRENLKDFKRREAELNFLKGQVFEQQSSDVDLALGYFEKSLSIYEKYGNESEIAKCLVAFAAMYMETGELDKGLNYIERAITLTKRRFAIGWGLMIKGALISLQGKIDEGVILTKQSLSVFEQLNNQTMTAMVLNNLGGLYKTKGDLDHALNCLEQAIALIRESGSLRGTANLYDFIIQILIEKGDLEKAQEHINQLQQIYEKLGQKQPFIELLFNKALILKTSNRVINRGKAEELLKQLLEMDPGYELKIGALVNLSDLLLFELKATNDVEVLQEINSYISQLTNIAENSGSYQVLGESYLLQAKLALLQLEFKEARRLLTQGQKIAEKFGLRSLAMKISNEHDELLTHLNRWEKIEDHKTTLPERMELARLNEQMENMVQKRVIEAPKLSDDEPIFLIIISEGGMPLFSQSFEEDKSFKDHLFGGFLSAINSFMDEMFSEGLDRASFGEHTLLMSSISPFFMCYIFKGQSYSAQQRISVFTDKIKRDKEIWNVFKKYYQKNQEVQLKDVPTLEHLIQEIFIDKTI